MNGIINIYKEKGFTSHDVVAKLRGILRMKKIGHTGTLDPDAEGVLPVCLGSGTKLCDYITDKNKVYEAVVKLGVVTDTQDMSGIILQTQEVSVSLDEIMEAFQSFLGEYDQIPPMYSAVKVNGQRLYDLARQGKEVERAARRVEIYSIELLEEHLSEQEIKIRVECGKGTYIRTLIHDAGQALGCGAAMKYLERTQVGSFTKQQSLTLGEVEKRRDDGTLTDYILPVDKVFEGYPAIHTLATTDRLLLNGNFLNQHDLKETIEEKEPEFCRMYTSDNQFAGLYRYNIQKRCFQPEKMFLQ